MKAAAVPGNGGGELLHTLHHNRTYTWSGSVKGGKEEIRSRFKDAPAKQSSVQNGTGHGPARGSDWILLPLFSSFTFSLSYEISTFGVILPGRLPFCSPAVSSPN